MTTDQVLENVPPPGILWEVDVELASKVQIVRAALELEVIPAVAAGHRDVDGIARATGCSIEGMRVLLDGLCVVGLLAWSDGSYELTPTSRMYLVPESPGYYGELVLADLKAADRFTENVRTGRIEPDYTSADAGDLWAAYARAELARWADSVAPYRSRWSGLGVSATSMPGLRVLDVGCGPAIASLVLALDDPSAAVTCVDRQPVLDVAARTAEIMDVTSQARFVAGDIGTLRDLKGPYDVVFFGNVFHFLDPTEIDVALRETRRLLAPDGRIVLNEPLRSLGDFEDPYPYLAAAWLFNVSPRGGIYTFEEHARMLVDAGFAPPRRLEGAPWLQAEVGP